MYLFELINILDSSSLDGIVHVKDENEEPLNDNAQTKTMINMAEATTQMFNHQYPQPVILLKRISLDNFQINRY